MKQRLAIAGCGDLGRLIAYHAKSDNHYEVIGFFDDYAPHHEIIDSFPILGPLEDIELGFNQGWYDVIMVGIGYKHFSFRKALFNRCKQNVPIGTVIHSSAHITSSATIGQGCFVLPRVTLDCNVVIGENVLLNTGVIVAHDTTILSHSFVGPGAVLAGKTQIGECCLIGVGSTVLDNVTIQDQTIIGGGAVVIKSLTHSGTYVGNPAKKL